ncbi:hypothetical protein [Caballeronia sp. SBC2]|uniref:hypothetical protein n=1 Tax=Caballeronia sp. SBC2 TaxID=2705547 RepID=UPI0013E19ADD|nr:hypothetical protein [Caballeronia sp. SBC2]QIE24893.1 hypothetical protein SBC2_29430 [Caballeronia sp. SBC2]
MIEDDVGGLKMLGYAVTEARMDARGWSGCSLTSLMVDFAMPGMNGPEAIVEAKRSRPKLAVTLATGDVSKDRVEGYAVLRKPFQIRDLARAVKAALTCSHVWRSVVFRCSTLNAVAMSRPS